MANRCGLCALEVNAPGYVGITPKIHLMFAAIDMHIPSVAVSERQNKDTSP